MNVHSEYTITWALVSPCNCPILTKSVIRSFCQLRLVTSQIFFYCFHLSLWCFFFSKIVHAISISVKFLITFWHQLQETAVASESVVLKPINRCSPNDNPKLSAQMEKTFFNISVYKFRNHSVRAKKIYKHLIKWWGKRVTKPYKAWRFVDGWYSTE